MVERLAWGSALFVGSLAVGWRLGLSGRLTAAKTQRLIRVAVKWLSPVVLCLSFWTLPMRLQNVLLPLLGGLVTLSALVPAFGYTRLARLTPPQTGSFLTCAMFSNLGYFGALIAFALFGEAGYSLAVLYIVHFSPCFYLVGFTLAKRFGVKEHEAMSGNPFSDELRMLPLLGMAAGLLLNVSHVPRPSICSLVNQVLIPVVTAIYLVAGGSQISFEPLGRWIRPCLVMSLIKFGYSPLVGWLLVRLFRMEGLPRFIVLLQASMPVAVSPLLLAILFGLDRKCASALWLFTTLAAIPWMWVYLPLIR